MSCGQTLTRHELLALGGAAVAAGAVAAGPASAQTPKRGGTTTIRGSDPPAESWSQPNETTYVFKLRRGARWQAKPPVNGRELAAEDVRYSVERFQTITGNAHASMLKAVDRVEASDKYTVKFTLKEPFVWFLQIHSGLTVAAWETALKNYASNFGDDMGGRLTAAWLDR